MYLLAMQPPFHEVYWHHFLSLMDSTVMHWFVWAVIIDVLTGFAKALVKRRLTSREGTNGLVRHGVILILVLTLYPLLEIDGYTLAGNTIVTFYIVYYALSIVENASAIGLPVPKQVKQYLAKLSGEYDDKNKNGGK